jgi:predicted aspartyl protease
VSRNAATAALILASFAATFASGQTQAPLIFDHGAPAAMIVVNGVGPLSFVIDTGTSDEAVLSNALAQRLNLPSAGKTRLTDLKGAQDRLLDSVVLDSVKVAGAEFTGVRAMVSDLPASEFPYDGILGFKFFRDKLLTLDFQHGRILLSNESLATGGDPKILPFRMRRGIPIVTLSIDGQQIDAAIDSGSQGLALPESLTGSLKFSGKPKVIAHGKTLVSSFEVKGASLAGNVDLGPSRFDKPFVEIMAGLPLAIIGSAALGDFAVTFDQRNSLVLFASARKVHHLAKAPSERELEPLRGGVLTDATMHSNN